jgi:type I site-specific restriction endonuclease
MNEADTCRRYIVLLLQAAGWDNDPHSIAEQRIAIKVRTLCSNPDDLRARWADSDQRAEIIRQLSERGIDFQTVAAQTAKPDADPLDLLCHLAFNSPLLTRRQRADRVRQHETAFFSFFAPEAHEILDELLEKYATDGEVQFILKPARTSPSRPPCLAAHTCRCCAA